MKDVTVHLKKYECAAVNTNTVHEARIALEMLLDVVNAYPDDYDGPVHERVIGDAAIVKEEALIT